jgi:hypothetical protein
MRVTDDKAAAENAGDTSKETTVVSPRKQSSVRRARRNALPNISGDRQ